MIGYYASGQSTSAAQWAGTAGLGIAVGIVLIWAGRYQRRRARESPDEPGWRRYRLRRIITRPSLSWSTAAKFYTSVGWLFAASGVLLLLEGIFGLVP